METREVDPAKPEPMPVNAPDSFEVVPKIIQEIEEIDFPYTGASDNLKYWLTERSDFGFKKYGARLAYPNGRDWHNDLCQELADAVNYARGALQAGQISFRTYSSIVKLADCVINSKELPKRG